MRGDSSSIPAGPVSFFFLIFSELGIVHCPISRNIENIEELDISQVFFKVTQYKLFKSSCLLNTILS